MAVVRLWSHVVSVDKPSVSTSFFDREGERTKTEVDFEQILLSQKLTRISCSIGVKGQG